MALTLSDASTSPTSPVRPGLRYGSLPMRRLPVSSSSMLDRWVIRLKCRYRPLPVHRTVDWLPGIRQMMQRFGQLEPAERQTCLNTLVTTVSKNTHNATTRDELLAMSATIASQSLDLIPHDGQLIAARELLKGRFVEMATGEGKTLTMALAAAVSAQDGTPVHVLTSSDYLAERDAITLAPLYRALGLSVAFVVPEMSEDERRGAYQADIVHVTGKQVAFDWLRDQVSGNATTDRLASRLGSLMQRNLNGGPAVPKPLLRGLCLAIVDEADSLLIDEAKTPLVLSAPVHAREINREVSVVALTLARLLHAEVDFTINAGKRLVVLTEEGQAALTSLAERFEGLWGATRYRDEKVREALTVLHCWSRDRDYVVRDNRIELVDPHTGRALPDRRLSHGLQALLELKERCEVSPENDIVASLPFQRFFLSYVRLAGMSGTLKEVKGELACVYGLDVVSVPSFKPSQLSTLPARVFSSDSAQLASLIKEVRAILNQKRPVLIGTRTVQQSECISIELNRQGIGHQLLNASQDAAEAAIIAEAGNASQITVATNMAGRGTDIRLGTGVSECGGLHVISMAVNDSRRLDRQLAGRAARQGDPGSFRRLLSLDDPTLLYEMPSWVRNISTWLVCRTESQKLIDRSISVSREMLLGTAVANRCVLIILKCIQGGIEWRHATERQRALDACKRVDHLIEIGAGNSLK